MWVMTEASGASLIYDSDEDILKIINTGTKDVLWIGSVHGSLAQKETKYQQQFVEAIVISSVKDKSSKRNVIMDNWRLRVHNYSYSLDGVAEEHPKLGKLCGIRHTSYAVGYCITDTELILETNNNYYHCPFKGIALGAPILPVQVKMRRLAEGRSPCPLEQIANLELKVMCKKELNELEQKIVSRRYEI